MMQPFASTFEPGGVLGHLSRSSGTPSPSESRITCLGSGQPVASTGAPAGVLGHWSSPSYTPSWSESVGQPCASTVAPSGVLGQASSLSGTPSLSESLAGPPRWNTERPTVATACVAVVLVPKADFVLGT